MHRTGKHGIERRCRSEDEMLAKGMSLNKQGFWVSESMPEDLVKQKEEME